MFLLDTDHVTIAQQRSHPEFDHLLQRIRRQSPGDLLSVAEFPRIQRHQTGFPLFARLV